MLRFMLSIHWICACDIKIQISTENTITFKHDVHIVINCNFVYEIIRLHINHLSTAPSKQCPVSCVVEEDETEKDTDEDSSNKQEVSVSLDLFYTVH